MPNQFTIEDIKEKMKKSEEECNQLMSELNLLDVIRKRKQEVQNAEIDLYFLLTSFPHFFSECGKYIYLASGNEILTPGIGIICSYIVLKHIIENMKNYIAKMKVLQQGSSKYNDKSFEDLEEAAAILEDELRQKELEIADLGMLVGDLEFYEQLNEEMQEDINPKPDKETVASHPLIDIWNNYIHEPITSTTVTNNLLLKMSKQNII